MMRDIDRLTGLVIGASIRIHTRLGPGLFESVYHKILHRDLRAHGLAVESKKPIAFQFEGLNFKSGFIPDLIVERCLVVEIKSVRTLAPVFEKQVLTYLRLLDFRVGLLINFNTAYLKDGIRRIVNNY